MEGIEALPISNKPSFKSYLQLEELVLTCVASLGVLWSATSLIPWPQLAILKSSPLLNPSTAWIELQSQVLANPDTNLIAHTALWCTVGLAGAFALTKGADLATELL
jgi:hypothetical protein